MCSKHVVNSCLSLTLPAALILTTTVLAAPPAQSDLPPAGQDILNLLNESVEPFNPDTQKLESFQGLAIALAAEQDPAPADLTIVNSVVGNFPFQGKKVFTFKVLNEQTGDMHEVALDEDGQPLDVEKLEAKEKQAFHAQFGKIHPTVHGAMSAQGETAKHKVIVWLNDASASSDVARPDSQGHLSQQQATSLDGQITNSRKQHNKTVTGPAAVKMGQMGFHATADEFSPALFAELDGASIKKVAKLAEVQMIYPDDQHEANMAVARIVTRANIVESRGFTGFGVRVGEIEVGGRINTLNPYLSGVTQDLTYSCLSGHTTAVAGCIRSTHFSDRGISPFVNLWVGGSCGGWSSELQSRTNAAIAWGARAINNSWGSTSGSRVPDANAKFFDNIVMNQARTIVFAAGNRGGAGCNQGTDGVVTNPAIAYNVIAVGNINDVNTTWTGDDSMATCSSWLDPISTYGDREKPELAAPGTNIATTSNASPWTGSNWSGTSFAAPIVTGGAALLMQRNTTLQFWPESVKAILMATALQNVEGLARLSEKDGAGGVNFDRADDVARHYNGSWGGISYDCAKPYDYTAASMYLIAGKRTRVVIAWDQNPDYLYYSSKPSADLDLEIRSPSNTYVTGSASYDNTYEVVDFTPSVTGYHTIRVKKYRCDLTPKYLGFAWYRLP